jgi:hypothetical protein
VKCGIGRRELAHALPHSKGLSPRPKALAMAAPHPGKAVVKLRLTLPPILNA